MFYAACAEIANDQFWNSTFSELSIAVRAYEHRTYVSAWWASRFSREKQLRPLKSYLSQSKVTVAPNQEEMNKYREVHERLKQEMMG